MVRLSYGRVETFSRVGEGITPRRTAAALAIHRLRPCSISRLLPNRWLSWIKLERGYYSCSLHAMRAS